MTVRLAVCGDLTVTRDGEDLTGPRLGTRKARVFVAALAGAGGATMPADRLIEAVWPDRRPRDPHANLATFASRLRKVVGEGFVEPGGSSYALGRGVELDLDVAGELIGSATARVARGEPTLAQAAASRALHILGSGDELAEECSGSWADGLRQRARALRRDARHLLARVAVLTGDAEAARAQATAAVRSDPYDERAHRDLMIVLTQDGRTSAALEVYAELATRLADELGTDPDAETRQLHLAILRGEPAPTPAPKVVGPQAGALVGRQTELARLDGAWNQAASGHPALLLVAGVPGIGKSRLLAELAQVARTSGGLVLATRCRPGERSLFLQPLVEVLRPVLLSQSLPTLRTLLTGHLATWTRLLPELAELFDEEAPVAVSGELARRLSFDAVVAVVLGLAERQPVLLSVDDVQDGADATADLLAHLAARLDRAPVLVVAATRTEGLPRIPQLTGSAPSLLLGPLPPSAVDALASAAGLGAHSAEVQARSRGHPLSVVASLRSLASGTRGVPVDLASAVAGQIGLLAAEPSRLVSAASILGTRVEPPVLARLADVPEIDAVLTCEALVTAGLLSTAGVDYEFANDLIQEAVLAGVPHPLAVALHRRAADLMTDRPERMAQHAHQAGELHRAAAGYLEAGRVARRSAALADALALLTAALEDAKGAGDDSLIATVLLERARAHEARPDYEAAEADLAAADEGLTAVRDPRLQMRCLRLLGGDILVARHRPLVELIDHNRAGLRLADELGDAVAEALFLARITVLEASRLHLRIALEIAVEGVRSARSTGSPEAVARSLDGLKSVLAYCGDSAGLRVVLDELLPLLDQLHLPWLMQWSLLESSIVPAAAGRWSEAMSCVDQALEVNRTTGYGAYAGFFRAHRAWLARLAGDLDTALDDGRRSVAETSPADHPWWYATAVGAYATTLLELGRDLDAAQLCAAGLSELGDQVGAAYRLRLLAPLAAATTQGLEEADALLGAVQAPPGLAWVTGADAYVGVATAWRAAGEHERARMVCAPLLEVTSPSHWAAVHARARQSSSPTS